MTGPSNGRRVLGLIPARGGSKSIPHKNITPLLGRPLVSYTCDAAQNAKHLNRIIASTDDETIASAVRAAGVEVPFLRPAELAQDDTPSIDVALHAVEWLERHEGWRTDILVLLQPTSPLRSAHHIDEAIDRLLVEKADTVVSVVEVPHNIRPWSLMKREGNRVSDYWTQELPFDRFCRQGQPVLYARNGPAILATRADVLFSRRSFYGDAIVPYVMDARHSVDIDDVFDLEMAEFLLRRAET